MLLPARAEVPFPFELTCLGRPEEGDSASSHHDGLTLKVALSEVSFKETFPMLSMPPALQGVSALPRPEGRCRAVCWPQGLSVMLLSSPAQLLDSVVSPR